MVGKRKAYEFRQNYRQFAGPQTRSDRFVARAGAIARQMPPPLYPIPKRYRVDNVVTNQHDYTTQYVKKTMPRYKKKAWRKFVNKVVAVADKEVGLRTILLNDAIDIAYAGNNQLQGWGVMHLYGRSGTNTLNSENGAQDLFEIFATDANLTNTFGGNVDASGMVKFKSATIDITMFNNTSATVEVDVYKIWYKPNEKQYSGWVSANTDYEATQKTVANTSGNIIKLTSRGATPFDLGHLIGLLQAKIVWKKKFLLGGGQTSFFQHRDAKEHFVRVKDMQQENVDFTHKKMTTTYLFICKDVANGVDELSLRVGASRHYTYKAAPKSNITRVNQVL